MDGSTFIGFHLLLTSILLIVVGLNIRFEYNRKNVALLFWLAILAIYVLPLFTDGFTDVVHVTQYGIPIRMANNVVLLNSTIFAIGFSAVYLLVRIALPYREAAGAAVVDPMYWPEELAANPTAGMAARFLTFVAGGALAAGLLAIIVRSGIGGLLHGSYQSYRLDAQQDLKLISYYLAIASSACVFLAWSTRQYSVCALGLIIFFGQFLLGRTRQLLMPAAIPFAMYVLYRYRGVRGRALLVLLLLAALGGITLLQLFRYRGGLMDCLMALGDWELYKSFWETGLFQGGEFGIRFSYYFFMHEGVEPDGFLEGLTYRRLMWLPIPASMSGGMKPGDFTADLYYEFYHEYDAQRPSLHTLMFGDAYTNFGWWGVLVGAFWATVARGIDWMNSRQTVLLRTILLAIYGYAAAMLARGAIYNSCACVFWTTLLLLGIYAVFFRQPRQSVSLAMRMQQASLGGNGVN